VRHKSGADLFGGARLQRGQLPHYISVGGISLVGDAGQNRFGRHREPQRGLRFERGSQVGHREANLEAPPHQGLARGAAPERQLRQRRPEVHRVEIAARPGSDAAVAPSLRGEIEGIRANRLRPIPQDIYERLRLAVLARRHVGHPGANRQAQFGNRRNRRRLPQILHLAFPSRLPQDFRHISLEFLIRKKRPQLLRSFERRGEPG